MRRRKILRALGAAPLTAVCGRVLSQESANEIRIGQSSILSGPVAPLMRLINDGAQLAFDQINGAGGIGGRRLRLVALDDALDADRALRNYEKLIGQSVIAMLNCVGSPTTQAGAAVLRASGTPLVGAINVSDSVRRTTEGVGYYVRASYAREVEAIVQHVTTIGIQRIALAYLDNSGGAEVLAAFRSALDKHGAQESLAAAVKVDGSDATAIGERIGAARPQAVVLFCPGPHPARVMAGVWASGASTSFYGTSLVSADLMFSQLGEKAAGLAISQIVPYPLNATDPSLLRYQNQARSSGQTPSYYGLEGYINASVLVAALQNAGPTPSRQTLQKALRQLRLRFGAMQIDFASGETLGSRFVELVMLSKRGDFVR